MKCGEDESFGVCDGRSHPTRGAWIEMTVTTLSPNRAASRTPRGVRGLKLSRIDELPEEILSHPTRGAWIEIDWNDRIDWDSVVAPHAGCVD